MDKYIRAIEESKEWVGRIHARGIKTYDCVEELIARLDGITCVASYDREIISSEFDLILEAKQVAIDEWFNILRRSTDA